MNITIPKFCTLIGEDYSLDTIYILENLDDVVGLMSGMKAGALLQKMLRKGLIDEQDKITTKGQELLAWWNNREEVELKKIERIRVVDGLTGLHKKLEDKLIALTGKKQQRPDIYGSKYSYLCNDKDLQERVKKVIKKYGLTDYQKIEDQLLKYVERCAKANRWTPLIEYYIYKNKDGTDNSPLVTDIRSNTENQPIQAKKEFEI